uniref:Oxidation resistance protein 1 n=1 Tax=Lotharella globosa TaxID=91324 RepID=A0A7S3ZGZ8_9EUKA
MVRGETPGSASLQNPALNGTLASEVRAIGEGSGRNVTTRNHTDHGGALADSKSLSADSTQPGLIADDLDSQIQIKSGRLQGSEVTHYDISLIWYLVSALGFGAIALRNRKQVETIAGWAKSRAGNVTDNLGHVYHRIAEHAPKLKKLQVPSLPSFLRMSGSSSSNGHSDAGKRRRSKSNVDIELVPTAYEYTPQLLNYRISPILSKPVAKQLAKDLPIAMQMDDWKLLYSSNEHGSLLNTFYEKSIGRGPTVLIVKDESNAVFGAFISESWRKGVFGNGQTFVFTVSPELKTYKWTRKNTNFCNAQMGHISIGGPRCGIWLDEKLRSGMSETCETFDSPPLSKSTDFNCYGVELWGIVVPETISSTSYR